MIVWTQFHDMHSGGGTKLPPYERIYIEASEEEAKVIFWKRFERNPQRVTCTCCGEDYSISSHESLAQLTAFDRGCRCVETKRDPATGLYLNDDPNVRYLEEGEEPPAGYGISRMSAFRGAYRTLEEYAKDPTVLIIHASEIKPREGRGSVPEEGYVWVD